MNLRSVDIVPEDGAYRVLLRPTPSQPAGHQPGPEQVVRPMPRRRIRRVESGEEFGPPPFRTARLANPSVFQVARRLVVWVATILFFVAGTLGDVVLRRDAEERRAVRLRRLCELAGGTFIKIGQQLSVRTDMLSARYCHELSKMLDYVPAIATGQAIEVIERTTGRPLAATFAQFDPEPIGSASIACVYQAVLRATGERVAVKVRRPGIDKVFAADLRIINFLFGLLEGVALIRPGLSSSFRRDFRNTILEELDFRREARLQEIFRRKANASRRLKFSAQRVNFDHSNGEVIVQEFAAGMWLYEILDALERHDPLAQQRLQELGIDPRQVARNLMYANFWGMNEAIAFHADPHPANIVVRPNNHLIFVDFGASGYIDHARRRLFQRGFEAQARGDAWSLVQAALALCEPLPPVDVPVLARELEQATYNYLIAVESKHAEWWERTTAALWTHAISVIARYGVPVPMDLLKFARASLMYDTIASRLDPTLDIYAEYRAWANDVARGARRRVLTGVRHRLRRGPTDADFARLEHLAGAVSEGFYRLDRLFTTPVDFLQLPYTIEKSVFTVLVMLRFALRVSTLALALIAVVLGLQWISSGQVDIGSAFREVVSHPAYLIAVAILAAVHLRMIVFRLSDRKRGY